jgi:tRNAThr (cytosine32-N3)-methyltransferase
MADNFYVRGDGTRVYFFEKDELAHIWGKYSPETGLPKQENTMDSTAVTTHEQPTDEKPTDSVESGFEILNLAEDRRLVVNRQRKLKMQACFRKKEQKREPSENPAASTNDADQTQKS